jgi:hypothetical protein
MERSEQAIRVLRDVRVLTGSAVQEIRPGALHACRAFFFVRQAWRESAVAGAEEPLAKAMREVTWR